MVGRLMFDTPTFELHANNGPLAIRMAISMILFSLIGVCLRSYAKRIIHQPYLWDDGLIIVSLICSWSMSIMEIYSVNRGNLGQHKELLKSQKPLDFLYLSIYIEQILYIASTALTKFSLTILYRRLFGIRNSRIKVLLLWFEWFLGLRLIATGIVSIIPCVPVKAFWHRSQHGKCINITIFLIILALTNIVTVSILLVFPIPIVWNLKISRSQKIGISATFLLGGLVIIISICRFATLIGLIGTNDFTWAFFPVALWTTMETNIGIFCVCIPSMRPLLNILPGSTQVGPRTASSIRLSSHNKWWPRTSIADDNASFKKLHGSDSENLNTNGFQNSVSITATKADPNEQGMRTDAINVKQTIEWH